MEKDQEITLSILLQYRDYMTVEQLERLGDYVLRIRLQNPFTLEEIELLEQKKNGESKIYLRS
jgi:hypothetical protein